MRTSIKDITSEEASRAERLTASGAFCVMVGLVVIGLAVLAFIVALV
jgi:hypothetical protein